MNNKAMNNHSTDLLTTAVGFGVGVIVWFLRIPDQWVLGEFLKAVEALILGGIGALGAWLVRRHVIKHMELHGSLKLWLKHIFSAKSKQHDRDTEKDNQE